MGRALLKYTTSPMKAAGTMVSLVLLFLLPGSILSAESLVFKYTAGERYRIVTEVREDVLVNGKLSHKSEILNRVAVDTLEVDKDSGRLSCTFQLSEAFYGGFRSYFLRGDYTSMFWRDSRGGYRIDKKYFMPVLRNVPFFPSGEVNPGDTWTAEGEEVHDLRRAYGINEAIHFPVTVQYSYLRNEVLDGKKTAVIRIRYTAFHRLEQGGGVRPLPVRITGMSEQLYYWDIEAGKLHSYDEDFDFIFFLSDGSTIEFRGSSDGRLILSRKMDRNGLMNDIREKIDRDEISDASVREDEDGVTLVLENIQFRPDSAELAESEQRKLRSIAEMLKKYPDRDFLITGHTARVGPEDTSQKLSEQRAMAVSDYLLKSGACNARQVTVAGRGSKVPLGDNDTEEGRRKNRRVEIKILEN